MVYHLDQDEEDLNLFEVLNALEPVADGLTSASTSTKHLPSTKPRTPAKCTTRKKKTHREDRDDGLSLDFSYLPNCDSLIPMSVVPSVSHTCKDVDSLDLTASSKGKTIAVTLDMTKVNSAKSVTKEVKEVIDVDNPTPSQLALPIIPSLPTLFE